MGAHTMKNKILKSDNDTHEFVAYFQKEMEAKDGTISKLNDELIRKEARNKLVIFSWSKFLFDCFHYRIPIGVSRFNCDSFLAYFTTQREWVIVRSGTTTFLLALIFVSIRAPFIFREQTGRRSCCHE